jgi:hypothetical protein
LKGLFPFTLIGGWAVYLYTEALKSKDIDLIVDFEQLGKLREQWLLHKNERLKKYEFKVEEIDVDVYVPYFSNPGLPAEQVIPHTVERGGFTIPEIEILLFLKLNAHWERRHAIKGEKDKLDVLSLLQRPELDVTKLTNLFDTYQRTDLLNLLIQIVKTTREAPELDLNAAKMARFRKALFSKLEMK